ncbi:F0F1 ATP synthase subunit delta [Microbacterium sp. M28]|uniref:F0F1 ATP synthase subunit delta n=1 Tax=Microbacterium sp. M28 TaxID=2962064 RepID=UPI0021F3E8C1|nr:F0F1 ATP synthase subunit delta [Microbacterium sp. M28]UYO98286.1 F0F1 ATP synthase subunit delta [Microbacterium sp. M28]
MGSATTQALSATTAALSQTKGVTLGTAEELFAAARLVGGSSQLSGALADPSATAESREKVVRAVFAGLSTSAQDALVSLAVQRWSDASDLVDGIEELAIRAVAIAKPKDDIEGELFGFLRVVAGNPELELALGSRLGDAEAKGALVEKVISGATGAPVTLIISSLVRQPRERRVRQLLNRAIRIVAAQRGLIVATVHTAKTLSDAQRTRLIDSLSRRYGGQVTLTEIIDPHVVGGLRVQVADDVIDGSISARLADLRQKLAG